MKDCFLEEVVDACFEIYGKSPVIEKGVVYGIGIKEWVKWLSYNSKEDEKRMLILIDKYVNQNCTKEEYYEVYNYMSNSIEDIMLKKLTSDELKVANDKVKRLEKLSDKELRELINTERQDDIYNNLSMTDAYILHQIIKIDNIRNARKMNRRLELIDNETTSIVRLSSVYSQMSKPCLLHPSIQNLTEEKLYNICESVNEFDRKRDESLDSENIKYENGFKSALNGSKIYQKNRRKNRI